MSKYLRPFTSTALSLLMVVVPAACGEANDPERGADAVGGGTATTRDSTTVVGGWTATPRDSAAEGGTRGGPTSSANASTNAGGTGGINGVRLERAPKPRVIVLTDISNEPDDEESLVRFLVYSNEYDVEGLIATTSTHLRSGTREDLIRAQIDAYERVRPNLVQHASGYPSADALRAVTATGQAAYAMAAVATGKASAGSDRIIAALEMADERPLWIAGWGGMNTLAQALTDVRASRSDALLAEYIAKLRVYAISDQDDAGAWLRSQFPELSYIVSPGDQTANEYSRATWSGISGDAYYANGPGYCLDLVANAWLDENVRTGHGPLGSLYPNWKYIMEGDTPSFLGLIDNGLGSSISPSYGGWGGRYALSKPAGETRKIWTNSSDSFEYAAGSTNPSAQATIWRWRAEFQRDFAARMDWCVADSFEKANHNPMPSLNGELSKSVITLSAHAGTTIGLTADGTQDPDNDGVTVSWLLYPEAGTLNAEAALTRTEGATTEVSLAQNASGTLHVILHARYDGTPPLSAYRRAIIDVGP